jgi:hypothetical protein
MQIDQQGRKSCWRISALCMTWGVIVAALTGQRAAAATVSFAEGITNAFVTNYSGTHDTMVVNTPDWEDTNTGGRTSVQAGTGYAGGASAQRRRILLRFDNLNVMAGQYASIDSAKVVWKKLAVSGGGSSADVDMFLIHTNNVGWVEGTGSFTPAQPGEATWNNRAHPSTPWAGSPGLEGAGDIFNPSSPTDTVNMAFYDPIDTGYEFDLLPGTVNAWINGTFPNAGLLFKQSDDQIPAIHELYSSEYNGTNAVNLRPRLVIEYTPLAGSALGVPEPSTMALLLLVGALWAARRGEVRSC